jgi:hypothetical protein
VPGAYCAIRSRRLHCFHGKLATSKLFTDQRSERACKFVIGNELLSHRLPLHCKAGVAGEVVVLPGLRSVCSCHGVISVTDRGVTLRGVAWLQRNGQGSASGVTC